MKLVDTCVPVFRLTGHQTIAWAVWLLKREQNLNFSNTSPWSQSNSADSHSQPSAFPLNALGQKKKKKKKRPVDAQRSHVSSISVVANSMHVVTSYWKDMVNTSISLSAIQSRFSSIVLKD